MVDSGTPGAARRHPSIAAAIGLWLAYIVLLYAIQASAGISYDQWFATAENAWRTAVASLAAGCVLLLVFQAAVRWDHVWRDPQPLETTSLMKLAMVLWWLAIAVRLAGTEWSEVPRDLLLAIVVTGVLVGFAEEALLRGFVLRGLREGGRNEAAAALWTAVLFGLLHLPNVFLGTGVVGTIQILIAALSGVVLYVFRRHFGVIWPAMVAHGAWDISTFLSQRHGQPWASTTSLALFAVMDLLSVAILIGIVRRDRRTVAIPAR